MQLEYDAETDFYTDLASGDQYVKCDARSGRPSFLNVSGDRWETRVLGYRCSLDWAELEKRMPLQFVHQAREAVLHLVRQRDPKYLNQLRLMLTRLGSILRPSITVKGNLKLGHPSFW